MTTAAAGATPGAVGVEGGTAYRSLATEVSEAHDARIASFV